LSLNDNCFISVNNQPNYKHFKYSEYGFS
jgi:hypothetical protein